MATYEKENAFSEGLKKECKMFGEIMYGKTNIMKELPRDGVVCPP